MHDSQLINNIKTLKAIRPTATWSENTRVHLLREMAIESEKTPVRTPLTLLRLLVTPTARMAVAGTFVFTVIISVALWGAGNEAVQPAPASVADATRDTTAAAEQDPQNGNVGTSQEASSENVPIRVSQETQAITGGQEAPEELSSFASLNQDDPTLLAYAELRQRINRLAVLGYEGSNTTVMELASEADVLYLEGDYDAALRVVVVAEQELEAHE